VNLTKITNSCNIYINMEMKNVSVKQSKA